MRARRVLGLLSFSLLFLQVFAAQAQTWTSFDGVAQSKTPMGFQVVSEKSGEIVIDFDIPGMTENEALLNGEYFTKLSVPGASIMVESGKPELPTITKVIEVPAGSQVTAEILDSEAVVLSGYNVMPHQVTYDDGDPDVFQFDTNTYNSNAFFPGTDIVVGDEMSMRGHSLVAVTINPLRYNPVTGQIVARSYVEIAVRYTLVDSLAVGANTVSSVFENLVAGAVVNPQVRALGGAAASPMDADPGAEYLIITHDDFYDAQNPTNSPVYDFAQHKIQKGLSVKIVTLSEIGTSPTADDIRSYVQDAYYTWTQSPVYLLLVGDGEQIPVSTVNSIPTDLYYGAIDTSNDFLPDLLVGRFPAKTMHELTTLVDKAIDYETDTTAGTWRGRILFAAYLQDTGLDGKGDRGYLETAEEARAYTAGLGYDARPVYTHTTNAPTPTTYSNGDPIPSYVQFTGEAQATLDMISIINEGIGLGAHRDHGSPSGWSSPSLSVSDIAGMNNSDMLPFLLGINCQSGKYHNTDGFGEQMVEYENGGAIGYVGASVNSPTYLNHTLYAGLFDAVFPNYRSSYAGSTAETKMAAIMLHGKMFLHSSVGSSAKRVFEMYNLQGDPELDINLGLNPVTTYTVEAVANEHGAISPEGTITVNEGDDITFNFTPDPGYKVYRVYVNGGNMGARDSYTLENVQRDSTIEVFFTPENYYYTIDAAAGPNGTISPSGNISVPSGDDRTFTITPIDQGYRIKDVKVDGESVGAVSSYTFSNVIANHTIEATFAVKTYLSTIDIRSNPSEGGDTYPSGLITDKYIGETLDIFFFSNPGYQIKEVLVNGESIGNPGRHQLELELAYYLVEVEFEPLQTVTCDVISGGHSGNFDTTDEYCFKTQDDIQGWGCSNMTGRTLAVTVNGEGTPVDVCGANLPSKNAEDYYVFNISDGGVSWANIYWW